ncbi:MAG: alanine dehydrogenase, partial [Nitrospirota bacterium]
RKAARENPSLAKGVNLIEGKITYKAVAEAFNLSYTPLEEVS